MRKLWCTAHTMGVKRFVFGAEGIDHPHEFIHHRNHSLFIASKLLILLFKVSPKSVFPSHHTHSHLEENASEMRITLFGNTHFHLPFARLLDYRISSCIFDELFGVWESFHIFHLSQESSGEVFRDTLYGRDEIEVFFVIGLNHFSERVFQFCNSRHQEKELIHVEPEYLFKAGVRNTDGILRQKDELGRGNGRFSTWSGFPGEDLSYFAFVCFSDSRCRGIKRNDGKEGFGEDVKVLFCFRKENGEGLFDLSFSFSNLAVELFNMSCNKFGLRRDVRRGKELRIGECKESENEGIFLVGLRGIVGRDKSCESTSHFGIDEKNVEIVREEKGEKRNVESAGRFENHSIGDRKSVV